MMSHWSVKALCVCTPEVEPCQRSETDGPTSSNHSDSPSRSSFSSLLASLLSRRSCFSISELIRLASFASSLRQQAIMESKVITAWAEKPVGQGGGEAGYTSRKAANKWSWAEGFNKLPRRGQPQSHALVSFQKPGDPHRRWSKLLSSVKYLTAQSASCAKILRLRGLAVVQWRFAMQHVCKHLRWLLTVQTSILLDARSKWAAETSLGALEANCC